MQKIDAAVLSELAKLRRAGAPDRELVRQAYLMYEENPTTEEVFRKICNLLNMQIKITPYSQHQGILVLDAAFRILEFV